MATLRQQLSELLNVQDVSGIDPRAHSKTPLPTTDPLPHISRSALLRVVDRMAIPTECPYCDQPSPVLTDNSTVYGKRFGQWPYIYLCIHCGAYVGLHPHTDIPLGTMANSVLRNARKNNKRLFLTLQKVTESSRKRMYHWLADQLSIPVNECHWAWFTLDQCLQAGNICEKELDNIQLGLHSTLD